jgi:DNA polymerase epsilon subunit 2
MKVTLPVLQRVYKHMQNSTERQDMDEDDILDPESHLFFIDAFEMPLWHWSPERSTFEK